MELKEEVIKKSTKELEVTFKKSLPGFDNLKKFAIIESEEYKPFCFLKSLDDKNISFVIISPFLVEEDYEFKLEDRIVNGLKVDDSKDILVYSTVTLNSDIRKITANLSAPIVINIKNGLGEQIILDNPKYKIKHQIKKEM